MLKRHRIPLYFLFIGSVLGVFLRWQFITPTAGVTYTFFLHAHSHVMFLGWIFNALYIGFVSHHIPDKDQQFFQILFNILSVLVAGMMISFPLQGYGFWSILISTLHTIGAAVFAIRFAVKTRHINTTSIWYARVSLLLFMISTAGPFSLAYLMAHGMGNTIWYNLSLYFYLHFQYNGFFFFGVLALFFALLERKSIRVNPLKAKSAGVVFAFACAPAYLLSTLWAKPGHFIELLGALAALVQCAAYVQMLRLFSLSANEIKGCFTLASRILLSAAFAALGLKLLLQFLSAHPYVAQMAYELRPVVIAYLHLMLVGFVSAMSFIWYIENNLIKRNVFVATILFLAAFSGMEVVVVLTPWWPTFANSMRYNAAEYTFGFASLLSLSYLLFLLATFSPQRSVRSSLF